MIRSRKDVDWTALLQAEDLPFLEQRTEPNSWYPMEAFERMGNAILRVVGGGDLQTVKTWGRLSVEQLQALHPELVAEGNPAESLFRLQVLRSSFFDFDALKFRDIRDYSVQIEIDYGMGALAEEAATHQALGVFERILELSGATGVQGSILERSWAGDQHTLIEFTWTGPTAH